MPEPEGPMTATISARGMTSETESRATTSRLPANWRVTRRSSIIAGGGAAGARRSDPAAATGVGVMRDYVNFFTILSTRAKGSRAPRVN